MILPYYIASRIHFSKDHKKKLAEPAVKIATIGIAIGLAVMIITISIIIGFKDEIREKIIGFGAHFRITNMEQNASFEMSPIHIDSILIYEIKNIPGIHHIQFFATKPGIIKNKELVQGVVVKGIGSDYDWTFLQKYLVQGRVIDTQFPEGKNEVLISTRIANTLKLKLNDDFICYFFQDKKNEEKIKVRKFKIVGIYNTNFLEFDKAFIYVNLSQIQKISSWDSTQIGGLEIAIDHFEDLDTIYSQLYDVSANTFDDNQSSLLLRSIKEINPQIFGWLDLLNMNVWIILILMASVASFNMISGLLIIILEQTNKIGILKALGSSNWLIQKIFLMQSFFIIGKGIIWGNVIALIFMFVQFHWKIIKLNPVDYYVNAVPINFNISYIIFVNIATLVLTLTVMLLPSLLITFISPSKSIKFE